MAAISFDPARKLTLYFRVARDGSRTLNFLDANGAAKDVSGHSFELNIKYRSSDTTNVIQFADGDFTKDSIDEITIPMTIALSTIASMEYYWELNVTLPDTSVHTWLTGNAIFHNGEFDGVTETTSITVDETSGGVTITINEGGSSSGTDADAIHKNVDDEFSTIPEKTTLSGNDLVLIEDSEDGNSKKKAKRSNVLGTSGSGDVLGPASAIDSNFAAFDTTTGKLIKDSGSKASDFATAAQGALADTALQSDDVGSAAFAETTNFDAAGSASTVQGNLNTHTSNTSNPHSVTKSQVGLSNVDNTSDANKPVSTAQQTALDAKQATLVSATNIKTINGSSVLGSGDLTVSGGVPTSRMVGDADLADDITTTELRAMIFKPSESIIPMVSDFIGTITPFDSSNSGSGTAITFPSFAGEQGVARTQTGTTTTGRAFIGTSAVVILETGLGAMRYESKLKIDTLSDGTEDFIVYAGFGDGSSAEHIDGMYFRYNHAVNSGNWQAICRSNSSETSVDTGIAASTTAVTLTIDVNAAGTSVVFSINGTVVATIASDPNIPTGNRTYGIVTGIRKTAGTTSRIVDHFYMLFRNPLTSTR